MRREFKLKVSSPEGVRVPVFTEAFNGEVKVEVPYISEVEADGDIKDFSKKGVISFTVCQPNYQEAIIRLTKYLEDLFLKGLENEHIHSSDGGGSNATGVGEEPIPRDNEESTGKDGNTVRRGRRGRKSSEGAGTGSKGVDVAKGDNKKS